MSDPNPAPSQRAEQALLHLRKLAAGNNLAPEAIQLFAAEEKDYVLNGVMLLQPLFETSSARYVGPPRVKNAKVVANAAALKNEVATLQRNLTGRLDWIPEAIAQLKEQNAGGWGLDDVRIPLPQRSMMIATSEPCPTCQGHRATVCQQCQGQGVTVCPHCQGRRQEICYICNGTGKNPLQPGQTCTNCNGMQYTPCRYCHGRAQLTCPACRGVRSVACATCAGKGVFTEQVEIKCGARTQFRIKGDNLPSGLRRGLDRLGYANLAKGYAAIELLSPVYEEDDESTPIQLPGQPPAEPKAKKPKPEVHYKAVLPYVDMKMDFAGKKAMVGIFGKKNALLGVPLFLDKAMDEPLATLRGVVAGASSFDEVLKFRLMADAMRLEVSGAGNVNSLRRLYPQGLSPKVAEDILKTMQLALNRVTRVARGMGMAVSLIVSALILSGVFMTPLHRQLTDGQTLYAMLGIDAVLLLMVLSLNWFALSLAARYALQRRFPNLKMAATQKTGTTGYVVLALVFPIYAGVLALTPDKPDWLLWLLARL